MKLNFMKTKQLENSDTPTDVILEDASKGERFANFAIDIIGFNLAGYLFGFGTGIFGMVDVIEDTSLYILAILILLAYYFLLEAVSGRTLGKLITGTKVVTEDGQKPSFVNIAVRTLCRCIPFEPFSFFGSGTGGWHDSLSKTRVIKVKSL